MVQKIHNLLIRISWLSFAVFWLMMILLIIRKDAWTLLLSFGVSVLVVILILALSRIRLSKHESLILLFLIAVTIIPRLLWIASVSIKPISDYKIYYNLALFLANNHIRYEPYLACFPHVIGYPVFLSLLFRIIEPSILSAQLMNLFFNAGVVLLSYFLVRELTNKFYGLVCGTMMAFWPSQILYTTILGNEPIYTFLQMVWITLFYLLSQRVKPKFHFPLALLLGVLLSTMNIVRPQALLLIFCVLIFNLLPTPTKLATFSPFRRAGIFLVLAVSYFLGSNLIIANVQQAIGREVGGSLGFYILVGANYRSGGMWNAEDARFREELYQDGQISPNDLDKILMEKAVNRITSDPWRFILLQPRKNFNLWGHDSYGIYWNSLSIDEKRSSSFDISANYETMNIISNIYYYTIIFISILAGWQGFWRKETGFSIFFCLFFLLIAMAFTIIEVQPRYHYHALPILAILSSCGLYWLKSAIESKFTKGNAIHEI